MSNSKNKRKGSFVAVSDKLIASCIKLVSKATQPFADVRRLDAAERRRTLRLRKGAAQTIPVLREAVSKYGLESAAADFDVVASKLVNADRLERLLAAVDVLRGALRDEILSCRSDASRGLTATYATLRAAAISRPEIATEIASVARFFQNRRRPAAKGEAPKPAAPSTEAPATSG